MAENRNLKNWTHSEKVNSVSVYAERFFTRLIMVADDYGCFYANTSILKANLFPLLLESVREADLLRWLAECEKAGLIVLYESESKRYLQIVDFGQRLRQKKLKFPLPESVGNLPQHADNSQPEGKGSRREEEVEEEPQPPVYDERQNVLFRMFKSTTSGYEDEFIRLQVSRFINKYPQCVAVQSGGLVNSWAARMNKEEQEKWKQGNKATKVKNGMTSREQRDAEKLRQIHGE